MACPIGRARANGAMKRAGRENGRERKRVEEVVSASGVIITDRRGNNFILSNVLKNIVAAKQTGCSILFGVFFRLLLLG